MFLLFASEACRSLADWEGGEGRSTGDKLRAYDR